MAKTKIKLGGRKKDGVTIPLPGGKKAKVPQWALFAGGGGVLAALFLMRGRPGGTEEQGVPSGILATEYAQRLQEERELFSGEIGQIAERLAELENRPPEIRETVIRESDFGPEARRLFSSGQLSTPARVSFSDAPAFSLSSVAFDDPADPISGAEFAQVSDAQQRADIRRGNAYLERAEAAVRKDQSIRSAAAETVQAPYVEKTVAQLMALVQQPKANHPSTSDVSAAQQRADQRRGAAYVEREQAREVRSIKAEPARSLPTAAKPMFSVPKGFTVAMPTTKSIERAKLKDERDQHFLDNPPAWY